MDDTLEAIEFVFCRAERFREDRLFGRLRNRGVGNSEQEHVRLERPNSGSVKKFGILPMESAR